MVMYQRKYRSAGQWVEALTKVLGRLDVQSEIQQARVSTDHDHMNEVRWSKEDDGGMATQVGDCIV